MNNCRQLIAEVGVEAVRRDNICKTQCSFALNSPDATTEGVLTAPPPPPAPSPPRAPQRGSIRAPNAPRPPLRPSIKAPSFFSSPTGPRSQPVSVTGTAQGPSIPIVPVQSAGIPIGSGTGGVSGVPIGTGTSLGSSVSLGQGAGPVLQGGTVLQSGVPNSRQPRPLFTFPSLRLPNLSDIFGI